MTLHRRHASIARRLLATAAAGACALSFAVSATPPVSSITDAAAPVSPAPAATEGVAVTVAPAVPAGKDLAEGDLIKLLTVTLQGEYVKDRGELELRLSQPWKTCVVPNVPLELKVLDMPTLGVTPMFVVRFELRAGEKTIGPFQAAVQAHVWKEVWVAHSALQRGTVLADADVVRERRDVLGIRESLAEFEPGDGSQQLADSVPSNAPILSRHLQLRPVLHRGQFADALVRDGALSITMKVEVMEDGAPGQIIRVRNFQTRRDLRGTVLDEQTILIPL